MKKIVLNTLLLVIIVSQSTAYGVDPQSYLVQLQQGWAEANYQFDGEKQEKSFVALLKLSDEAINFHPDNAELYIWRGIISSTYAKIKGGFSALKYAKASKADLEQALKLDDMALHGSAYTSLGTLYFKVPGWPVSFGNDSQAKTLLKKALSINPNGIDSNYFYAEYLIDNKQYKQAEKYLQHALNAELRPGRKLADEGRRQEILTALASVRKHLK